MKTSRRGFLGFLTGGAVAVGAGAVLPKKSEPLPNPDDYCGISDAMLGEPLGERVTATEVTVSADCRACLWNSPMNGPR